MNIKRLAVLAAAALAIGGGLSATAHDESSAATAHTCNSGRMDLAPYIHYTAPNNQDGVCYLNGTRNVNATATRALQSTLNLCYGGHLAVDGVYGTRTAAALKVAQRATGNTPDGLLGPSTGATMKYPKYRTTNQGTVYLGCTHT